MATNKQKPARERRHRKGLKIQLPQLSALDRRTRAFQLVLEARGRLLSDLGGEAVLSAMQIQLIDRAAVLAVVLEAAEAEWLQGKSFDLSAYVTGANALNRLLGALGLKRVARDVTPGFRDLIARRSHEKATEAAPA
jgi:hypothetical protein